MTTFKENRDVVVEVPLNQILVRKNWNGRSGAWEENDGAEEDNQFVQLMESIEAGMDEAGKPEDTCAGQDEPVGIRINHGAMSETFPYELVKGFRRYAAITRIAEKRKIVQPCIRAIVRMMTDVEARFENIAENTARKDLSPADQCWSIKALLKEAKANSIQLSGNQIAKRIGRDQTWVAKLIKLANGLRVEVLEKWRLSPAKISVENMLSVAELTTKEEQMAAFNAMVRIEDDGQGGETEVKADSWLTSKKKKAADIGSLLGTLEREELINTDGLDFDTHLDYLIKLPPKATANNRRSVAAAARKAWQTAKDYEEPEPETEDETEDETPRKRKRD